MAEPVGDVTGLWRYPVKSMLGEAVEACEVTERGLAGDRVLALIEGETGKVVSAKNPRKWAAMFGFRASLVEENGSGEPAATITFPDGTLVRTGEESLRGRLTELLGRDVTVTASPMSGPTLEEYWPDIDGLRHRDVVTDEAMPPGTFFDGAVVHVLTTSTLARLREAHPGGRFEPERFRPNILVRTEKPGFVENDWIGKALSIGDEVVLRITRPCGRCVMTTLPQGDLPKDPAILRIAAELNDVKVGVYATVERSGRLARGDRAVVS